MDKNSFYKPSGNIKDTNRTYVPNLYRQVAAEMEAEYAGEKASSELEHVVRLQNRPLIGVLYSISAGVEGELFPIYVGRNTIGSDLSCDICLRESSVSSLHGMLLARKQTNAEGEEYINVMLSDSNSSYGTSVNGERLDFERVTCADGDIISVGQNYVLILSLFNALNKLSVASGFDRMPEPKKEETKPQETIKPPLTERIIGGQMPPMPDNNPTKVKHDAQEEASADFYRPTKQQGQDHYNNQTIIL